jgi:hypothetical protein
MSIRRHQAWRDPTQNSITYWRTDRGSRPPNVSASAELLWEFDAATDEEAMSIHFLRLGWAPYQPNGDPSNCPTCGSVYYPNGYGQCWKCGRDEGQK